MLALQGASGVLAATGDEPASTGFWAAVDSVGKLYAIKGRQLADDVKTNYLQLAGGDPDDLDVPSAIIEDGFMDGGGEQPAAEAAPEADPEPAAPEPVQQVAPAVPDDAPFESDLMPSNILGLHYLLEAAKESGVQRILMASTGQVVWEPLNHGPWPVRAHVAPSPLSWYALTKVFAEEAGKVMARDFGMDVMMVRLGACPRSPEHAQQIGADPIARDVYFSPGDLAQFFKLAVSMP